MRLALFLICLLLLPGRLCAATDGQVALHEEFATLDDWEPVTFPKIARHSSYEVRQTGTETYLVAHSSGSASAIRHVREFDPYRYPVVKWRWKVDNVYARGNVLEKTGDDYPLRVYIMFKYDPARVSFGEQVQYGLAKIVYGAYPPHSSLNYIWANREEEKGIHPSPYTDRARLLVMRAGPAEVGRWVEEQVNILDDYRRAFGAEPPEAASIAIMNDSDNTGEAATSYLDYILIKETNE
ncbi:MAG: DUF3047 domain-containing protein [Desulfobulbaceae bacterium]